MQNFYNPNCLSCGSFFVKAHLFCEYCYANQVESYLQLRINPLENNQKHAFLINWAPLESELISEMVYRFKSNHCPQAWAFYAQLLAQELVEHIDVANYDALVPLPGSTHKSIHAQIFAKNLARHWGLPILNSFHQTAPKKAQKTKSGSERRQKTQHEQLACSEQFTKDELKDLSLIYVDDIMTTGSTYRHAQKSLSNEGRSLLVTLFYRPRTL